MLGTPQFFEADTGFYINVQCVVAVKKTGETSLEIYLAHPVRDEWTTHRVETPERYAKAIAALGLFEQPFTPLQKPALRAPAPE